MNFSFALNRLTDGMAAKRPNWSGYIKRVDGGDGAYNLVFVKRDGSVYLYSVDANGSVTSSSTLVLSQTLVEGMLADDWVVDTAAACEADRSGNGEF